MPKLSNQKGHHYLKEMAPICEIQKHINFHLARHTFATTVALSNGIPIETVSKILRHKKFSTTQIYAKVVERKLSDDMEMLQQKIHAQVNEEDAYGEIGIRQFYDLFLLLILVTIFYILRKNKVSIGMLVKLQI